jgi:hypothetical protein
MIRVFHHSGRVRPESSDRHLSRCRLEACTTTPPRIRTRHNGLSCQNQRQGICQITPRRLGIMRPQPRSCRGSWQRRTAPTLCRDWARPGQSSVCHPSAPSPQCMKHRLSICTTLGPSHESRIAPQSPSLLSNFQRSGDWPGPVNFTRVSPDERILLGQGEGSHQDAGPVQRRDTRRQGRSPQGSG